MLHLLNRFFGFLAARALTPTEQDYVTRMLTPPLRRLFYRQARQDQRHAFEVATRVIDAPELIEAALLHDIGKIEVTLGAFGRSFATLWGLTALPVWGQWRTYLEHGAVGAELLELNGAGFEAVAFTRHHPGPSPSGFDTSAWSILEYADEI